MNGADKTISYMKGTYVIANLCVNVCVCVCVCVCGANHHVNRPMMVSLVPSVLGTRLQMFVSVKDD